jgi:hypothetical protein
MSDIAIRVEGLGKRYRIGERERYKALRDVITDAAAAASGNIAEKRVGKESKRRPERKSAKN